MGTIFTKIKITVLPIKKRIYNVSPDFIFNFIKVFLITTQLTD